MCGQRTVLESAGHIQPPSPIRMQAEWLVAVQRFQSTLLGFPLVIRRQRLLEVAVVQARPLALFLVPPDQLLLLAPGLAVRSSRGPVVDDAHVFWPGKAP